MSSPVNPAMESFIIVILGALLVMGLSRLLDHVWAHTLRYPSLYLLVSAPGVIVHECSHVIGCILTGAKIRKVVLLSKKGGMVSYTPPAIPVLGNVIISTAPLFILPLVLAALTWFFGTYAGCSFTSFMPSLDSVVSLYPLVEGIGLTLYQNLVVAFNIWFLLYLYLVTSLALSFSPSTQDLKNAVAGFVILIIAGFCLLAANISAVTNGFLTILGLLGTGLAIGLAFGLIALIVSLPAFLFYRRTP
ncbi:MAG: metalloprotease family protein [Methanoregula sp.]|uniref:hypothetical protein n=1 Tax=Methanoregula sp. TaxID=2052170 RepID=UPI003BAF1CE8